LKEAIATQILLEFLLRHYVVFMDRVSLKSEGGTWGGSLVSDILNRQRPCFHKRDEKNRSHSLTHRVAANHFCRSAIIRCHPCERKLIFFRSISCMHTKTNFFSHEWHRLTTEREKWLAITRWISEWLLFLPSLFTIKFSLNKVFIVDYWIENDTMKCFILKSLIWNRLKTNSDVHLVIWYWHLNLIMIMFICS